MSGATEEDGDKLHSPQTGSGRDQDPLRLECKCVVLFNEPLHFNSLSTPLIYSSRSSGL